MDARPGTGGSLDFLNCELAAADAVATFAPVLAAIRGEANRTPAGQQCEHCCHWALPLNPPYVGRDTPHAVALLYHEWIVWHWHVVRHQRLDGAELVA